MVAPGVVAKNLVTASDSSQPRVVLDEGLKDIYGQPIAILGRSL